jgi:hypothetical protein
MNHIALSKRRKNSRSVTSVVLAPVISESRFELALQYAHCLKKDLEAAYRYL